MRTRIFIAFLLLCAVQCVKAQWWDDPFDDFRDNAFGMSAFGGFGRQSMATRSMFNPWLTSRDDFLDDDDDDNDDFFSRGMFGFASRRRTPLRSVRQQRTFNNGNNFNTRTTNTFSNFNRQNSFNTQRNFNRQNSFNMQSNFNRQNNFNGQNNFNRQNNFNGQNSFNRQNSFTSQNNGQNNFNRQTSWQQPQSTFANLWMMDQMDFGDFGFDLW